MAKFHKNTQGILIERLHHAGLLPPNCGDITITDNYNSDPVGIRISFHCFLTEEMIVALSTPTPDEGKDE